MDYLINIGLFVLGIIIGGTFADIDLAPPLPLKHRSAWTHGPLPFAVLWLYGLYPAYWVFYVAFLLAYALHLAADMFPHGWGGGALIKLFPLPITLPAPLSFIYLGAGVVYSLWAAAVILDWPWLNQWMMVF